MGVLELDGECSATIEIFARLQRRTNRRNETKGSATIEIFARLQQTSAI